MKVGQGDKVAFHEKARYPLRGAHVQVECKFCHGPFEGQAKAQYKDLAFKACTDCHQDAHLGQLGKKGTPQAACDRCHAVQGWVPVRFELADHQKTKYPLEGAHAAVACDRCHVKDPKMAEKAPAAMRAEARRQRRPVKVSEFTMEKKVDGKKCTSCHRDVHQGQFDKRMAVEGCTACHDQVTFTKTKFDHARDTKFRLDGKHGKTACASCHATATGKDGKPYVKYAGAPTACAKCHADPHAAQFAVKKVTECASCHGVEEWKKLKFVHGEPFTTYTLTGKHAKVSCEKCHPVVEGGEPRHQALQAGVRATARDATPTSTRAPSGGTSRDPDRRSRRAAPRRRPAGAGSRPPRRRAGQGQRDACPGRHQVLGLPHPRGMGRREVRPRAHRLPAHRAPRAGGLPKVPRRRLQGAAGPQLLGLPPGRARRVLGVQCASCHDTSGWKSRFDADAHRRTNFPLQGRHALLPCEQCHGDRRDRAFARPTVAVLGVPPGRPRHRLGEGNRPLRRSPGYPQLACLGCHGFWRWSPATLLRTRGLLPHRLGQARRHPLHAVPRHAARARS